MSIPGSMIPRQPRRRWAVIGLTALALMSKAKWLLGMLKLGKFAGTAVSMAVTIVVYALLLGWPFAVGLVALIFIHEMGHAAVIKARGIPAGAPVFIPLVGAAIALKGRPLDARVEAEMAIGGPLAGTAAALLCWWLYLVNGSLLWLALANVGFVMNLFNLLPISPLDGGRVAGAISKWLWVFGALGLAVLLWFRPSPILILVLALGGVHLWGEFRRPADERAAYYELGAWERLKLAVVYFGLAGLLGYLSMLSHGELSGLRPL